MRRVVLTALAALALVAFTFSGCKKETPVTPDTKKTAPAPQGKADTKSSPGQPTTVAPDKSAPAPADKQAAPAPTTPAPAPTNKPAGQ